MLLFIGVQCYAHCYINSEVFVNGNNLALNLKAKFVENQINQK